MVLNICRKGNYFFLKNEYKPFSFIAIATMIALLLTGMNPVNAQSDFRDSLLLTLADADGYSSNNYQAVEAALSNTRGTKYLKPEWLSGTVYVKGDTPLPLPVEHLRYRVYDDIIQFKIENRVYILDPSTVHKVVMNWQSFVFRPYLIEGRETSGYFEECSAGGIQLLKRWKTSIKKSDYDPVLNTGIKEDILFLDFDYYLIKPEAPAQLLKKRPKDIFKILPDISQQAKDYIKTENLNLKSEEDLATLISHLNRVGLNTPEE